MAWTSSPQRGLGPAVVRARAWCRRLLRGTVRAFNTSTCTGGVCAPPWSADAGDAVSGLAVFNRMLYAGTGDGLVGYGLPPE